MLSRFLYVESCGQCPACKFVTGEVTAYLENLSSGLGTERDIELIGVPQDDLPWLHERSRELSIVEERNRLARDIHDELGALRFDHIADTGQVETIDDVTGRFDGAPQEFAFTDNMLLPNIFIQ